MFPKYDSSFVKFSTGFEMWFTPGFLESLLLQRFPPFFFSVNGIHSVGSDRQSTKVVSLSKFADIQFFSF